MSVFVQLVSYKNFDTLPTVVDCIEKASDKAGVKFGVVLQQDEDIPAELNRPRVTVQRVPVRESKGPGWSRRLAQSMYSSEDHTLQVDSGTRFAEGWDRTLVEALGKTGSPKPIITNSPNKFNPSNGEKEVPGVAYRLQPQAFLNAAPSCWSAPMKGLESIVPTRMLSSNFIFTLGSHCTECKYDPSIYYSELDSAITVRSYTLGYDLFNHHVPTVWMDYGKRPHHWEDHSDWWIHSNHSSERLTELVKGGLSSFGLGTARSMEDYQRYSGLDFVGRRIHKEVLAGKAPPVEYQDEKSWAAAMGKDYSITVSWNPDEIEKSDDYDYWYFSIEDAAGNNIVRQDLRHERDAPVMQFKVNHRKVFMKSFGGMVPANLCIWPLSKSKGWLKKSKFPITSIVE